MNASRLELDPEDPFISEEDHVIYVDSHRMTIYIS